MNRSRNNTDVMCRYPGAARDSRGPMKRLQQPYVALLDSRALPPDHGSALVHGIEDRTAHTCVDLSAPHAGPDAILKDKALLDIAKGADALVLTVPGAHQLSNPYYRVHNWRNDRIIAQEDLLRALYPEVEFDRHHFVRHLLGDLQAVSPGRFAIVREMLQRTWLNRMSLLLSELGKPVILLWIGERWPDEECETLADGDPPFVTKSMAGSLAVAARVEVVMRPRSTLGLKGLGGSSKRISASDANDIAADRIADCLERLRIKAEPRQRRRA